MAFTQKLPVWLSPGVEPPEILKNKGWKAGMKPPDVYFNYLQNTAYLALKELQEKAAEASALVGKVDKEAGKGLSTNDYTTAEKTKLAGVEAGANKYTHPASHPPSIITQDANNRFVTDAEKANWNSKAGTAPATTAANGLMSGADKAKLDGIAAGANNYAHPATHPASMITEDAAHRFMTDAERVKLQGIDPGATNYQHPASHPAAMITEDASHRFMSDTEKTEIRDHLSNKNNPHNVTSEAVNKIASNTKAPGDLPSTYPVGISTTYTSSYPPWKTSTGLSYMGNDIRACIDTFRADSIYGTIQRITFYKYASPYSIVGIYERASYSASSWGEWKKVLTEDDGVSETDRANWNGKADTTTASTSMNGLMSSADKNKLNGIESGANKYAHPTSHSPSIISQDSSNRFVTDTEKANWNSKETTAGSQAKVNLHAEEKTSKVSYGHMKVGEGLTSMNGVVDVDFSQVGRVLMGSFTGNNAASRNIVVGVKPKFVYVASAGETTQNAAQMAMQIYDSTSAQFVKNSASESNPSTIPSVVHGGFPCISINDLGFNLQYSPPVFGLNLSGVKYVWMVIV